MKKIKLLASVAFLTVISACNTNDDGFYNETYVEIPDLVQIEVEPEYNVGDQLTITADFSRYLNEPGEELPLDIYATTQGVSFNFSYVLERKIASDQWETAFVDANELDVRKGLAQAGYSVFAHAVYNASDETYEYDAGIMLSIPGEYRLSFGYNSTSTDYVELRSDSERNDLFLNIDSLLQNVDNQGFYNFTVN